MVKIIIFGLNGSGKSTLTTLMAYMAYRKGRNVFSNYHLYFPNLELGNKCDLINPLQLLDMELEDCFLALDEIETLIDSRVNPKANRYITYFWVQARHRNVDIVGNAQLGRQVDCRAVLTLDSTYIAESDEKDAYFHYRKVVEDQTLFKFNIKKQTLAKMPIPNYETVMNPKKHGIGLFDLYNTYEVVYPPELIGRQPEGETGWNEIMDLFKDSPNTNAFMVSLRKINPYVTIVDCRAIYDYIEDGNIKQAKKIMGFKDTDS